MSVNIEAGLKAIGTTILIVVTAGLCAYLIVNNLLLLEIILAGVFLIGLTILFYTLYVRKIERRRRHNSIKHLYEK